jgi:hypothetical protein
MIMTSSRRIFFAGVGTTFLILGMGFGGGLMMANSALKEPTPSYALPNVGKTPVRVVLPTTAEPPQPQGQPQPQQVAAGGKPPVAEALKDTGKRAESVDFRNTDEDRGRGSSERKAKQQAEKLRQQQLQRRGKDAPLIAFGGDEPQTSFFGR